MYAVSTSAALSSKGDKKDAAVHVWDLVSDLKARFHELGCSNCMCLFDIV
jgi:hypothetical protein